MSTSIHRHAPWRKAVLIPFWVIQICTLLGVIGASALYLGVLAFGRDSDLQQALNELGDESNGVTLKDIRDASKIIVPVWIAVSCVCLILTISEIILLAIHKLKPIVFVIMNAFKTGAWTVAFVASMISVSRNDPKLHGAATIAADVVVLIAFWIPFIYGIFVFVRNRKAKRSYASVDKPLLAQETSYPPQYKNLTSEGSFVPVEQPPPARERRASYNHTRDTRFETFREQRRSMSNPSSPNLDTPTHYNSGVPQVVVGHHDLEAFEMDSARQHLR
ncbi:hypothetical protein GLAREA_11737 [Glarea lozoyensis ATCC 20868]|uniref:Uncharacterized protein n=1 Tax=Glarea lozoyensis (strain ATCC 20868 / MF5171) TaxID=1116229 RepID=S3CZ92_GLAL2|nr:uncharacterized protein GLAREA_11737 [Glarea lozoyensis ATCC 20868]EPE25156.1 hypothetical protein GLAREA_11737 [Glarea lozoyensis ATCC 20868]